MKDEGGAKQWSASLNNRVGSHGKNAMAVRQKRKTNKRRPHSGCRRTETAVLKSCPRRMSRSPGFSRAIAVPAV